MLRKILLLTGGLLIAGLFFIPWFFSGLNTQTAPDYSADESVFGLTSVITVNRDETGLPFISGSSENDFAFSLGYLQAQDRLWQMIWLRTEMKGETAALLGENAVEWDLLVKMLGIETRAAELVKSLSEAEKQRLQAYSRGVNEFIRIHETRLPFEFALLDKKPEPWKPEHSAGILLLFKWRYLIPEFKRKLLPHLLNLPEYRAMKSVLLPNQTVPNSFNQRQDSSITGFHYSAPGWILSENGWSFSISAFGEKLTGTSSPMVMVSQTGACNLPLENYLVSGRVGEQLTGLLAGIPGTPWFFGGIQKNKTWVVSGFSDSLDVGIINVPAQALRIPLSIEIKDHAKLDFLVPVLSSTLLLPQRLTGYPGDSIQVFLRGLNWKIDSDIPYLSGLSHQIPDKNHGGTIRFKVVADEKISTEKWAEKIITSNDTLSLGQIKNHVKLVKTDSSLFNLIYNFKKNGYLQVTDFQNLNEILDGIEGLKIKNKILPVLNSDSGKSIKQNLIYLNSWQGEQDPKSIGTSIFYTWKFMFFKNWLQEELGSDLFSIWLSDNQNCQTVLNKILLENTSFSKSGMPVTDEPVDLAIRHAFEDAIRYLQNNLGVNSFNWRWEIVNQASLNHKLNYLIPDIPLKVNLPDGKKPSNPVFNFPLFSAERQHSGQINQMIICANLNQPNLIYFLCPAGLSGNPLSPFFTNFSEKWSDQNWTVVNTGPIQTQPVYTLILRPGK